MLTLLAFAALTTQVSHQDRAAFQKAMAKVESGWTQAQVRALLGKPEDVWLPSDSAKDRVYEGNEVWAYGAKAHHSMPTLGSIYFSEGKVVMASQGRGTPPPSSVISEKELLESMEVMYRWPSVESPNRTDSQRLIQSANLLISKGPKKALAILAEFHRVTYVPMDFWLFWLVRVAYTSNEPGGVFPIPFIGAISPPPPDDLRTWPTYPILIVDDVPICTYRGVYMGGFPESFSSYLHDH